MLRFLLPLLSFLILASASLFSTLPNETAIQTNTVNAVLGDVSFVERFGVEPDDQVSEEVRIKTHLEYVIRKLKGTDTSHLNSTQIQKRTQLISLLNEYKEAGIFPKNHHFKNRRPVFIDREGNLCAVGYLIAQTEGPEAAQRINRDHKFDYIKDVEPALIDGWLARNGITKKEAAMIQPAYAPEGTYEETITTNNIELEYAVGSSLLAGAQIGTTVLSLLSENNIKTTQRVTAFNTALGLTSMTLGIINIDNTYTEVQVIEEEPVICTFCYNRYETTYKNPARTNFSIANIIVGGVSAAFNGFRFLRSLKQEEPSDFRVSATQLYDPASEQTAPALSFSMKF